MDEAEFGRQWSEKTDQINVLLKKYYPKPEGFQATVIEAMTYALSGGGKRLRPLMMHEVYRLLGGTSSIVEPFMAAIEMIHTYSLVHDDLPAMDDDAYRRGRKTTHIVFGEGMGILAGDALLNYAFETAFSAFSQASAEELPRVCQALTILGNKSGIYGMIGGQTVDLESENAGAKVTQEQLLFIHQHKTVALFEAAMTVGAVLAGASSQEVEAATGCAKAMGLAFQIRDDILDVTGTIEELGKPIGSDAKNDKVTYVSLHGVETAEEEVKRLSQLSIAWLRRLNGGNEFLEKVILQLVNRQS
jgi:geranylgeranyl diphosphate synthase type II